MSSSEEFDLGKKKDVRLGIGEKVLWKLE